MDLTAWTNEAFTAAFNVAVFAALGGDGDANWRLQARREAAASDLYLDIPAVGEVAFAAGVVSFLAPASAMRPLSGSYVWDMGYRPAGGGDFVRCTGGSLTVVAGVTRSDT